MTLAEMKKKVLTLIEEYDDQESTSFTNDEDIEKKIPYVINQIQIELARIKKIPRYLEINVDTSIKDTYTFDDLKTLLERDIYQISMIRGIDNETKSNGTVIKALEDGKLEIELYIYPLHIDSETDNNYEFELTPDVLEIMPYGVAGDILKSDVANAYGNIYTQKYERLKETIDPRYSTGYIEIEEGFTI